MAEHPIESMLEAAEKACRSRGLDVQRRHCKQHPCCGPRDAAGLGRNGDRLCRVLGKLSFHRHRRSCDPSACETIRRALILAALW